MFSEQSGAGLRFTSAGYSLKTLKKQRKTMKFVPMSVLIPLCLIGMYLPSSAQPRAFRPTAKKAFPAAAQRPVQASIAVRPVIANATNPFGSGADESCSGSGSPFSAGAIPGERSGAAGAYGTGSGVPVIGSSWVPGTDMNMGVGTTGNRFGLRAAGISRSRKADGEEPTTGSCPQLGMPTLNPSKCIESGGFGKARVYDTNSGLRGPSPSKIIEPDGLGRVKVYDTDSGFRGLTPSKIIEPDGLGRVKVYDADSGFRGLTPSKIIEPDGLGRVKVYDTDSGFRGLTPSKIIEPDGLGRVRVYDTDSGIRALTPSKIIEPDGLGRVRVYDVISGIRALTPSKIIETDRGMGSGAARSDDCANGIFPGILGLDD